MQKNHLLLFSLLFLPCRFLFGQCLVSPPPAACTGTESLVTNNEIVHSGTTKWYYGAPVTMNSLTMNGGTLIVCGDLTIDKFYMDSGTIYIRPGGRFVIGSGIGAGMQLKGNSSIYNYGRFECQRNLSLDNGHATAAQPNRLFNALGTSVFRMPNQYLVVNNRDSWVINNGSMECWGIITDNQSSPGSICLGYSSTTRMAILINRIANAYRAPVGSACLNVYQWSQFYGRLTNDPGIFACLGAGHTSDASCGPWGCTPNNWGAATVFSSCAGCAAIAVLPMHFVDIHAMRYTAGSHLINWQTSPLDGPAKFRLERSADGVRYVTIDSINSNVNGAANFQLTDKNPLPGNNYYMMKFINPLTGMTISSKAVKIISEIREKLTVYPVPFRNMFSIYFPTGMHPEKIMLTDITGRNIRISYHMNTATRQADILLLDDVPSDIYMVHMQTREGHMSRTILKK